MWRWAVWSPYASPNPAPRGPRASPASPPRIRWRPGERRRGQVEVSKGVHRLTKGVVNFYLLEEAGKLLLVDAGAPRDWDLLVRTVTGLGRTLDDIEAVVLTHAHSDHTGFAERARTTAGSTVWV